MPAARRGQRSAASGSSRQWRPMVAANEPEQNSADQTLARYLAAKLSVAISRPNFLSRDNRGPSLQAVGNALCGVPAVCSVFSAQAVQMDRIPQLTSYSQLLAIAPTRSIRQDKSESLVVGAASSRLDGPAWARDDG
jgi:hypothetical protein